jgi:hypothetical protein
VLTLSTDRQEDVEPKPAAPPSRHDKRDGQYAYALYKGKRYTIAELDAMLAVDRKKARGQQAAKRTDREELLHYLSQNVEDPDEPDVEYFCDEVYSVNDFSEAGDDRGWGEEDDVAVSWDDGDGRRPAIGRAADVRPPRQQRRECRTFDRQRGAGGEQPILLGAEPWPAWSETNNEEESPLENQSASTRNEDQAHQSTASSAAAVNDWDNLYDLPSFGGDATVSSSYSYSSSSSSSVFDAQPFPTSSSSSSLSLASFSPSMDGPVSYGMPDEANASSRTGSSSSYYNTPVFFQPFEDTTTPTTSSTSDRFRFDEDGGGGMDRSYEARDYSAPVRSDDHHHADVYADVGIGNGSSGHHHYESGAAAAEDGGGGGGGFGDLFNEEGSVRHDFDDRPARPHQRPPTADTTTKTARAGKAKGGERVPATGGRPQDRNSNVVVDLAVIQRQQQQQQQEKQQKEKEAKRREKWDARQAKREQFKRRQREERRLASKTEAAF